MKLLELLLDLIYPDAGSCPFCKRECTGGVCDACMQELKALELCGEAAYRYEGIVKSTVQRYKFGGKKYLYKDIARLTLRILPEDYDVITNVPIHKKRRAKRGYDQAELLARELSRLSGIPYEPLLVKVRHTQAQSTLDAHDRAQNIKGAFSAKESAKGRRILLVDDVITTGATMSECEAELLGQGAAVVKRIAFSKA